MEEGDLRQQCEAINDKENQKKDNNCPRISSHIKDSSRNWKDNGTNAFMPRVILCLIFVLDNPPMAPLSYGDAALCPINLVRYPIHYLTLVPPMIHLLSPSLGPMLPKALPPLFIPPLALSFSSFPLFQFSHSFVFPLFSICSSSLVPSSQGCEHGRATS